MPISLAGLLLLLLCSVPTGHAVADPPGQVAERAARALADGDHKAAISLLSPPPLSGPETCVLAEALVHDKQSGRAMLYLDRCHRFQADADVRHTIARLKKVLRKRSLAPLSLSLSPASATARIDAVYDEEDVFLNDEDLWLPYGSYRMQISAEGYEDSTFAVVVDSADRMLVPLSLHKKAPVVATEIDLGEDAGAELGSVATTTDPRPKKFETLLADRYRRAPDPTLVAEPSNDGESSLWPLASSAGGAALVGAGVALHLRDNKTAALVGYGAGASLLGVATYLYFRSGDGEAADKSSATLSVSFDEWTCALRSRW